jgi:hypothetical protein
MRLNTYDTVVFTWYDKRQDGIRELNTALRNQNIIITDIAGIDNWTISRTWLKDPATARQLDIGRSWEQIAFEIKGVIVDDTKTADKALRAFTKTAEIVHMSVNGFENLDRDFYITAFSHERYGNVRSFTISCVNASGHISIIQTKRYDFVQHENAFTFPFSCEEGEAFVFGYSALMYNREITSDSFIDNEPFIFTGVFSGGSPDFEISNDDGRKFRIIYNFKAGDILMIDMVNSAFRLTREGGVIPILPYIDYAGSKIFGIKQGTQVISIKETEMSAASIIFTEHAA